MPGQSSIILIKAALYLYIALESQFKKITWEISCLSCILSTGVQAMVHMRNREKLGDAARQCNSVDGCMYTQSNVIVVDESLISFQQYLRYYHKIGTIVFSVPSVTI